MDHELTKWAEHYARNRAQARGSSFEVEKQATGFVVHTGSKQKRYRVHEKLSELNADSKTVLVTKQTKANVDVLLKRWVELVNADCWVIFVNEDSLRDKYWIIHPRVHNLIADPASLGRGILSMASLVDWC